MKILTIALSLIVFGAGYAGADELADAKALGKTKFVLCGACHGLTGNGQPAPGVNMAPSFLDSKLLKMPAEISAFILFKGIKKEDPAAYMGQIMMPLGAQMPDEDVAALITFVRSEFAGVDELVTAEQVAGWRKKYEAEAQPTRVQLEEMKISE